jgi:hypothetical protein
MEILCLLGTAIGLITCISPKCANKLNFFALWIYYLSIYQVSKGCLLSTTYSCKMFCHTAEVKL